MTPPGRVCSAYWKPTLGFLGPPVTLFSLGNRGVRTSSDEQQPKATKNMMSTNKKKKYWPDVAQDKKVPSDDLSTGSAEVLRGATSPQQGTTHDQKNDHRPLRPKTVQRKYNKTFWTVEEKKTIYRCYAYSRGECWGRRKAAVFKEQIDAARLPKEKVQKTTMQNLQSITSQIHKYLSEEEMREIEEQERDKAERDHRGQTEEEKLVYSKSKWTRVEKWTILWATSYAAKKQKNQHKRCEEWQKIFYHHCPDKTGVPKNRLTCQKYNILTSKIFTEEDLQKMEKTVEEMVKDKVDPLTHPIPTPTQAQVKAREQSTTAAKELSTTAVEETLTNKKQNKGKTEEDREDRTEKTRKDPQTREEQADEEQRMLEEELLNTVEEIRRMPLNERPKLIKMKETKHFKQLLTKVNETLPKFIPEEEGLEELNNITYGSALYIQRKTVPRTKEKTKQKKDCKKKEPPWKTKLQKRINQLRAETSQMMSKEPLTKSLINKRRRIQRKYNITTSQFQEKIAEHQANIKGLAAEVRNKEKKNKARQINKLFQENPRTVYQTLIKETIEVENPPEEKDLDQFWRTMYETPVQHKEQEWINVTTEKNKEKPAMPEILITTDMVTKKIKDYANFKTPGIDKIPNFWLKKLEALHEHYARCFDSIVQGKEKTPDWLTTGNTTLIPKSKETTLPSKYRPICCLPTTYKWLTGIIADAIYEHLENGSYMEEEQKGCRKNRQGTKHQLLINKMILEDCKKRQRNLNMCWIDYKKAYDSVPHSWIIKCLELYKIDKSIVQCIKDHMQKWRTNIMLKHTKGEIQIKNIRIQKGIFQGDSLSPLLFCMAIDPLSKLIKNEEIGYSMSKERSKASKNQQKISHLLFMDDLKMYADTEDRLEKVIKTVHSFSEDIGMDFGLDKCSKCTIRKGKKAAGKPTEIDQEKCIEDLEHDATYKYLGIEENASIEHKKTREKAKQEYIKRVKKICRTELTSRNKVTAINQLAIPVLTYSFGIIEWPQKELNSLDVKTRKILTMHKILYRNQCMDRVYLPRREGGLGLIGVDDAFRGEITNLSQYLEETKEELLEKVAIQHADLPESRSITKLTELFMKNQAEEEETENTASEKDQPAAIENNEEAEIPADNNSSAKKGAKRQVWVRKERARKRKRWKNHQRAGRFYEEINKNYIDKKGTFQWIQNGELGFDGERMIIAAQDQGLMTNGFKKMCGISKNDQCRFCNAAVESTSHLISGCQILMAEGHYTQRHNKVCKYLHWKICQAFDIPTKEVWNHEPASVAANDKVTIFYDKEIKAGRYIENKAVKPDIVVWDKENKTAQIIEVNVPNDFGLNRGEREKVTKYQDLKNDLKDTWELKHIDIVPVIIGATGVMKTNLQDYLEAIPGKPSKYQVQAAAIRGTVSLLKRALGTSFQ